MLKTKIKPYIYLHEVLNEKKCYESILADNLIPRPKIDMCLCDILCVLLLVTQLLCDCILPFVDY